MQEILLGTGLGVRAYSIIEQQKIDLILSTKPQDRRRLIEEAAGVSKYKIRKRQAEVKLEETARKPAAPLGHRLRDRADLLVAQAAGLPRRALEGAGRRARRP